MKTTSLKFALPKEVPDGLIYVPPGSFLYGTREGEVQRAFHGTSPMHERQTEAFYIARTETTYAQWIEFLDDLPPELRDKHTPHIEASTTNQSGGKLQLRKVDGTWELSINPAGDVVYVVRAGELLEYGERQSRKKQDWLQFPVSGITPEDALAYAAWLDTKKRAPRARMCDEVEWERASRGVDGRKNPHGSAVNPDDMNIDVTYGRSDKGFGPDAVGSHPASTSPFGLADSAGNVWEMLQTQNRNGFVMRGGGYYTGTNSSHLANRQPLTPTFRHLHAGLRICADP